MQTISSPRERRLFYQGNKLVIRGKRVDPVHKVHLAPGKIKPFATYKSFMRSTCHINRRFEESSQRENCFLSMLPYRSFFKEFVSQLDGTTEEFRRE